MKLKTFLLLSAIGCMAVLFNSCRSNTIYFDLSAQTINTCDGAALTSLFFAKSDHQEYGTYEKVDGQQGTAHFNINLKNPGYMFDSGSYDGKFSFDPNGDFLIRNMSNGDAASSQIEIKTDSNGKVTFASKTECN